MTDHPEYTSTLPPSCLQEWSHLKCRVYMLKTNGTQ